MRFGAVLSFVLLIAPMSLRPTPSDMTRPTLQTTSVTIETISKSDHEPISLTVSINAPTDHLLAAKPQFEGEWYEGSSFETVLNNARSALKSDFVGGEVTLTPSRPLSHDWTYHCYVRFSFSDRSVINIGWRDATLKGGARSVTHKWTVAHCLPDDEAGDHSSCELQMTFKGLSGAHPE